MKGLQIVQIFVTKMNINLNTHSEAGRAGDPDLELPLSEMMSFMELAALRWLLELSDGNSGKLLEKASGTYPKKEPPSSPK